MKIKKGDNIIVISGVDKGKTGSVGSINPSSGTVIIEGINLKKRHYKKSAIRQRSGIEKKSFPILISKIAVLRPGEKNKGSRVGYKFGKNGEKIRVFRQAGNKEIK